jgi:tryptophan synthase alpha chain
MTRYAAMFDRCTERGEGVFGAFLMLGDPGRETSAAYLDALVEGGADMVELGIPFSDPVADGPVVQAAAARALGAGVRTADCLAMIADFRARHPDVPVGILTYANIVAARGIRRFGVELATAGTDSLLFADVPTLEAEPYAEAASAAGIDLVMIAAPNTPEPALRRIAALSSGYTYCVARDGVTGADRSPTLRHSALFEALSALNAAPPILGFGIGTPGQVREALDAGAAGVISGSALVGRVAAGDSPKALSKLVSELKAATRR